MTAIIMLTVLLIGLLALLRYVSHDGFSGPRVRRPEVLSGRYDELGRLRPYLRFP